MNDLGGYIDRVVCGDCLEVMPQIQGKVDMVLCDLPYGVSACKWDVIIPFEPLWVQYKRLIKDNGAIVLTASQPFTSMLVMSNPEMFKYEWIWNKSKCTCYFDVFYRPMKAHENILVFGYGGVSSGSNPRMVYRPIGIVELDTPRKRKGKSVGATCRSVVKGKGKQRYTNFPDSILSFSSAGGTLHPTQKPVALFEYLIKTYTDEGDVVLDNCIGSGTTAVACIKTGRHFIGIEKERKYCDIAEQRIAEAVKQKAWDDAQLEMF